MPDEKKKSNEESAKKSLDPIVALAHVGAFLAAHRVWYAQAKRGPEPVGLQPTHEAALIANAKFLASYQKFYAKEQKSTGGIGTQDGGTVPGGPPPPPPIP